jgi:antitoxin (DNA-binding transcriptional repressor) of toxin-antitoxin stability system
MHSTTIQALDARQRLGELLELVYYKGRQFRIARKNKPMAWLVGEPFMAALGTLLKQNPRLAETIEIMLDEELVEAIKQGTKEVKTGKTIPIEKIFEE